MNAHGESRDDLANEANVIRGRLMHTIEQLDRRRHEAFDLRLQLRRHMAQIGLIGALAIIATGIAVGVVVDRIRTAADRRRQARRRLLMTVWRHPDRVLRAQRAPLYLEALRSLGLSLLTAALAVPLPGRLSEGGGHAQ
jgi:hypothetical protein